MTAIALSLAAVICALIARDVVLRVAAGKRDHDALRVELLSQIDAHRDEVGRRLDHAGARESAHHDAVSADVSHRHAVWMSAGMEADARVKALSADIEQIKTAARMRQ